MASSDEELIGAISTTEPGDREMPRDLIYLSIFDEYVSEAEFVKVQSSLKSREKQDMLKLIQLVKNVEDEGPSDNPDANGELLTWLRDLPEIKRQALTLLASQMVTTKHEIIWKALIRKVEADQGNYHQ